MKVHGPHNSEWTTLRRVFFAMVCVRRTSSIRGSSIFIILDLDRLPLIASLLDCAVLRLPKNKKRMSHA
jgi:hypothetical protein